MNGPNSHSHQHYPQYPQPAPGNFAPQQYPENRGLQMNQYGSPTGNQPPQMNAYPTGGYQPQETNPGQGGQASFDAQGNVYPTGQGRHQQGPQGRPAGPGHFQPATFGEQVTPPAAQPGGSEKYVGTLTSGDLMTGDMTPESVQYSVNKLEALAAGDSDIIFVPRKGGNRYVTRLNTDDEMGLPRYRVEPIPASISRPVPTRQPVPPAQSLQQPPIAPNAPGAPYVQEQPAPNISFGPTGAVETNEAPVQYAADQQEHRTRPFTGMVDSEQRPRQQWTRGAPENAFTSPFTEAQKVNNGAVLGGGAQISKTFEAPRPERNPFGIEDEDAPAPVVQPREQESAKPDEKRPEAKPDGDGRLTSQSVPVKGDKVIGPLAAARALNTESKPQKPVKDAETPPPAPAVYAPPEEGDLFTGLGANKPEDVTFGDPRPGYRRGK